MTAQIRFFFSPPQSLSFTPRFFFGLKEVSSSLPGSQWECIAVIKISPQNIYYTLYAPTQNLRHSQITPPLPSSTILMLRTPFGENMVTQSDNVQDKRTEPFSTFCPPFFFNPLRTTAPFMAIQLLNMDSTWTLKKNFSYSGDCTNCGNTTEATTLLQQFIKKIPIMLCRTNSPLCTHRPFITSAHHIPHITPLLHMIGR